MGIQIEAPDGTIVVFPDGTSDADIELAMRAEYGTQQRPTQPQRRAPARNIAELVAGGRVLPQRGENRPLLEEASGAAANLNRGIPFGNDISRLISGLTEAAPAALDIAPPPERPGLGGDYFGRIASAFGRGVDRYNRVNQDAMGDFQARRPYAASFAQGTGAAIPIALTMGAATPEAVAANTARTAAPRGFGAWARQTANAGATGAAAGEVYGVGTSDGDLNERLQAGNEGGAWGGAFGLATPTAVNTGRALIDVSRPAWEGVANLASRVLPTVEPNAVGAMGGNLRPPRPRAPRRPPIVPPTAINTLDRVAQRARMSPDDVEQAFTAANQRGMGETPADLMGDPGVRTTRAIVQAPGESGERAAAIGRTRFSEAPRRITNALRRGLAVSETRQDAIGRLAGEYDRASAELYTPVLRQTLSAEQRNGIEGALRPFADDPVLRDAVSRAQRIFARDRAAGLVTGSLDDNFARYAHFLKMGLDDAVAAAPIGSRGLQATEMRGVNEMRRRIVDALDANIPGYQQARARWGGLRSAEEALDEGAQFLHSSPEAVRARLAQMTPFEREHARIGLVDEITRGMRGGRIVGQRNVANALDYADTQEIIASAFDNPQQAAEFLDVLNTQNRLMRNAQAWGNGSPTYSNALHGADEMLHAGAEMAGHASEGNFGGAIRSGANRAANALLGGAIERTNNVRGAALLQQLDTPDAPAFIREVVRELRRRAAARAANARISQAGATAAGANSGQRRN